MLIQILWRLYLGITDAQVVDVRTPDVLACYLASSCGRLANG